MKAFNNEKWKLFEKENYDFNREKIYISNYGRVKKEHNDNQFELVTIGKINKFETFAYPRIGFKKKANFYVHRAVGFLFLDKKDDEKFVIHKNHDLTDNYLDNLKWVNQKELTKHQHTNPKRKVKHGIKSNAKLTVRKVTIIKKKLLDPNRKTRLRIIASQFGITTTQLYRIKSGENWGEIKIK
jgi:hypothetical protein